MGRLIQNNFCGGEISPTLFGRSDLQSYYKGCAMARNFVISKEGTLRKRHGIVSVSEMPAAFSASKIVPYQYDRTQAGFVLLSAAGSTLTASLYGKDCVLKDTATSSGFSGSIKDIQSKQIGDQVWITNGSFFKIVTVTDFSTVAISSWQQATQPPTATSITAAGYDDEGEAYNPSSGRDIVYAAYIVKDGVMSERKEVTKIWDASWVAGYRIDVKVTVPSDLEFDYIVLAKKIGGSFGEVSRWYNEDLDDEASVTFRDENISAGDAIYAQSDVLGHGFANPVAADCFQQRMVFANAEAGTTKTVSMTTAATSYTAADGLRELLWVRKGSVDYTSQCTVAGNTIVLPSLGKYRIRYVNGTVNRLPMTMWFSEAGNLYNFYADRPSTDSDPFSPTISSTGPSFIQWIATYNEMMVLFTDSGLFTVGFSQNQGFSSSTCRVSRFSNLTVSPDVQPIVTDAGIVFVGADNKTVYTAAYDLQENMLKPVNRMVLAEHLTRTAQIKALALQVCPDNVIWAVLTDGTYATFTFERNEEVYAWSEGSIRGAKILDVIAPGSVTDTDSSSASAERTYGDLVFVVSRGDTEYLCRSSAGWADSIGGTVTNVTATLKTLRPESQEKTIVGLRKNVKDVVLRLYETGSIAVRAVDGGTEMPLVSASTGAGLFTGEVKVMPRGIVNDDGQMEFVSDDTLPCEILQIVTLMEVG